MHNFGRMEASPARRPNSFTVHTDMWLVIITFSLHGNKESYDFLQHSSILYILIQSFRIWLKLL